MFAFMRRGPGMARVNRREVLAEGEIQVVHCVNRCVRRGFLCGTDELTGKDYEHRRQWKQLSVPERLAR